MCNGFLDNVDSSTQTNPPSSLFYIEVEAACASRRISSREKTHRSESLVHLSTFPPVRPTYPKPRLTPGKKTV